MRDEGFGCSGEWDRMARNLGQYSADDWEVGGDSEVGRLTYPDNVQKVFDN